jgi:hypothetical protein
MSVGRLLSSATAQWLATKAGGHSLLESTLSKRLPHPVRIIDTQFGLELVEAWRTSRVTLAAVSLVALGLASAVGFVMGQVLPAVIGLCCVAVAAYPVWAYWKNKTRVQINTREVRIDHGPVPLCRSHLLAVGDIREIHKTQRGNLVDIQVELTSGRRLTMLSLIADDKRAAFIVRQARRHLNIIKPAPLPVIQVRPPAGTGNSRVVELEDVAANDQTSIRPAYAGRD